MEEEMFIAWIRHIAWMSYRIATGEDSGEWTEERIEMDLDGVRYLKRNPESTAKANHENWMKKKKELEWKWGAVKDEEAKIHPGLMPYDELPKSEALKNVACFFAHREAEDLWKVLQKSHSNLGEKKVYTTDSLIKEKGINLKERRG